MFPFDDVIMVLLGGMASAEWWPPWRLFRWHRNVFRITGPLWGEWPVDSTHKETVMWTLMLSLYYHKQAVDEIIKLLVICDVTPHAWRHCKGFHDDVIKWKHFPRYWPFVSGIHGSPVDSPHKGQWRGALMFSLVCAWTNGWSRRRMFETPLRLLWRYCNGRWNLRVADLQMSCTDLTLGYGTRMIALAMVTRVTCPNMQPCCPTRWYYNDVIMDAIASQITNLTIVYSIVNSSADKKKHQSSASLAFVRGIHRRPVNSPHKWPVTRKMLPFDDVMWSVLLAIQRTCKE